MKLFWNLNECSGISGSLFTPFPNPKWMRKDVVHGKWNIYLWVLDAAKNPRQPFSRARQDAPDECVGFSVGCRIAPPSTIPRHKESTGPNGGKKEWFTANEIYMWVLDAAKNPRQPSSRACQYAPDECVGFSMKQIVCELWVVVWSSCFDVAGQILTVGNFWQLVPEWQLEWNLKKEENSIPTIYTYLICFSCFLFPFLEQNWRIGTKVVQGTSFPFSGT